MSTALPMPVPEEQRRDHEHLISLALEACELARTAAALAADAIASGSATAYDQVNEKERDLDRLDRLDVLYNALQAAKLRATSRTLLASLTEQDFGGGNLGPALYHVFSAQRQVITPLRLQTAQLDLSTLLGGTWRLWRDRARARAPLSSTRLLLRSSQPRLARCGHPARASAPSGPMTQHFSPSTNGQPSCPYSRSSPRS